VRGGTARIPKAPLFAAALRGRLRLCGGGSATGLAPAFLIALAAWVMHLHRTGDLSTASVVAAAAATAAILARALVGMHGGDVREPGRKRDSLLRLLALWSLLVLAFVGAGHLLGVAAALTRLEIAALWLGGALILAAAAVAAQERGPSDGRRRPRAVILGAGELGQRVVRRLRDDDDGLRLVGLFDDRRHRVPDYVAGFPVLGSAEEMGVFVRRHGIEVVLIALPAFARRRIETVLERLAPLPVEIRLCLDPDLGWLGAFDSRFAGLPTVRLRRRPLQGWNRGLKEVEDRLLALFILVLTAPLLAAIAAAIRLTSPGPVFYRQKRYGFAGEVIEVLKFRTMHAEACDDGTGSRVEQARRGDLRVTPLGRWLRRWSLDELPQFWNVLRGEMSIVGPRPHAIAHDEAYARFVAEYFARLRVKPGITGWAQVHGLRGEIRSLEELRRRIAYDLDYVDNWSLCRDLEILARTLLHGLYDARA